MNTFGEMHYSVYHDLCDSFLLNMSQFQRLECWGLEYLLMETSEVQAADGAQEMLVRSRMNIKPLEQTLPFFT